MGSLFLELVAEERFKGDVVVAVLLAVGAEEDVPLVDPTLSVAVEDDSKAIGCSFPALISAC